MAGKPQKREGLKAVAAAGGAEAVLSHVAEGATIKDLALELGVSRSFLSAWCNADERKDAYARARREAAQAHAEQALSIVDKANPETVQVAKLQSDFRRWMAARMDPPTWGESKGAQVNIDLGRLHLEAVKEFNQRSRVAREAVAHDEDETRSTDE